MADISLKFGVQGDQNMKSALAAINSEIKGLDAEMKLAVSQMQTMGSTEEKNAKTAEILQKQYKANADKVELLGKRYSESQDKLDKLGKELDEAKKTTGENSEEVQKLQEAYNKQKKATTDLNTELTKAKTKMQDAKNGMDSLGNETEETAEQLKKGEKSASTFADTLKAKLTAEAVIAAVKKLAKGLKELAMGAVTLSDELVTQSQVTGLSTDALQEYNYMAELVDVSVDTITGSLTKLTKNMSSAKSGTGSAAEAFKKLGINVTDANGNLRNNQDVFNEIIDALGRMEDGTERDALAMELFGKSAQELNPLINAGSKQIKAYAQEAHEMGYVMDEDVIAKNLEASDAYERMKNSITAAKNYVGSKFAPVIEKASETVMKLVQAAKENEGMIQKLVIALGAAAAAFVAYKVAVAAADAVTGLMAANPVTLLIAALAGLVTAAIAVTNKTTKLGEETEKLIKKIDKSTEELEKNTQAYYDLETAKQSNIDGAKNEFSYYENLAKELDGIVDENGKVKKGYEDRAKTITGVLKDALGVELSLTGDQIKNYQTIKDEIYKVIEAKKAEAIMKAQEQAYTEAITKRATAQLNLVAATNAQREAENQLKQKQAELNSESERLNTLMQQRNGNWDSEMSKIAEHIATLQAERDALTTTVDENKTKMAEYQDAVSGYSYNIQQYEHNLAATHDQDFGRMSTVTWELVKTYMNATPEVKKSMEKMYGEELKWASQFYAGAKDAGEQGLRGSEKGFSNITLQNKALSALSAFGIKANSILPKMFQIKSPSKVTEQIGKYFLEGFGVGLEDEENNVLGQVKSTGRNILGAFEGIETGMTTINGQPAIQRNDGTYVIQLMLDGKQIATSTTNIQSQRARAYAL